MPYRRSLSGLAAAALLFVAGCSSSPPGSVSTSSGPPSTDPSATTRIHDIQGAAHRSPFDGKAVASVPGIVTALSSSGFYMEDPLPDADPSTSEGIFVYTVTAPTVTPGQYVRVSGTVSEYRPGGAGGTTNLSTTEIATPTIVDGGKAPAPLPPPVVIGTGGRVPPIARIAGPAVDSTVESASYAFNPERNGIDFFESLEGMRVVVPDAVAVGPTTSKGETAVIGNDGANAGPRSARGGVVIGPNDFHPERIILSDTLIGRAAMPKASVGDRLVPVQGVLDYSFGNFKLMLTAAPLRHAGPIARETTALKSDATHLTIASFNVENLSPTDPASKFAALGSAIVTNLQSPDIVALMEIQDNDGAKNNGVVDATLTIETLTDAIAKAGGPTYSYREIDPVANQDGGEPGGNIRQVLLFDATRVGFVDRPGASPSTTAVTAVAASPGVRLSASPGRIAPADPAFDSSRKPLAAEFMFGGRQVIVIANHLNSKGGDGPLFGRTQPPVLASEVQRLKQVELIAGFVSSLKAADRDARIVVLGDMNDFQFSPPMERLKRAGLADLLDTLPADQRYSYVYEGNSEALDHILVSDNLKAVSEYDVVHINAEFFDQISDHDPEVARLAIVP